MCATASCPISDLAAIFPVCYFCFSEAFRFFWSHQGLRSDTQTGIYHSRTRPTGLVKEWMQVMDGKIRTIRINPAADMTCLIAGGSGHGGGAGGVGMRLFFGCIESRLIVTPIDRSKLM